jgi:hypothetical protein
MRGGNYGKFCRPRHRLPAAFGSPETGRPSSYLGFHHGTGLAPQRTGAAISGSCRRFCHVACSWRGVGRAGCHQIAHAVQADVVATDWLWPGRSKLDRRFHRAAWRRDGGSRLQQRPADIERKHQHAARRAKPVDWFRFQRNGCKFAVIANDIVGCRVFGL